MGWGGRSNTSICFDKCSEAFLEIREAFLPSPGADLRQLNPYPGPEINAGLSGGFFWQVRGGLQTLLHNSSEPQPCTAPFPGGVPLPVLCAGAGGRAEAGHKAAGRAGSSLTSHLTPPQPSSALALLSPRGASALLPRVGWGGPRVLRAPPGPLRRVLGSPGAAADPQRFHSSTATGARRCQLGTRERLPHN